jgi:hypothetical protein
VSKEDTNEIPIVQLLRQHLNPVEQIIGLSLDSAERAKIEEVREMNLRQLVAHAIYRRSGVLARGKGHP